MNTRFISGSLLLAACTLLITANPAFAQDIVAINSPAEDSEIAINTKQLVVVRWVRGRRPVPGRPIEMSTTFGTLSSASIITDSSGVATVEITSDAIGNATITASAGSASDELDLRFIDPGDEADRWGDLVLTKVPGGFSPMFIYNDRVGISVWPGVKMQAVLDIAAAENLVFERELDDRLFTFKLDTTTDRTTLRELSRRLQDDHESVVRKAGLVAQLPGTKQWFVVPDEIVIQFKPGQSNDDLQPILAEFESEDIRESPYDSLRMVIRMPASMTDDVFQLEARLSANDDVVLAVDPNYIIAMSMRSPTLEPGYGWQWTLESNTSFGLDDADIDIEGAWDYSVGSHDTLIAIVDRGFEVLHADLFCNLWPRDDDCSTPEFPKGIDVYDNDNTDLRSIASNPDLYAHGTNVAGIAGMDGSNNEGYSGACPECLFLLIRSEQDLNEVLDAFDAAIQAEARIISNSWGFPVPFDTVDIAIARAKAADIAIFFAMDNFDYDNCNTAYPDISCDRRVIAVSGVTDQDKRSGIDGHAMGYGAGMDIMAPTAGGDQGVITTSTATSGGVVSVFYTNGFSGTSAATPLAAGVGGLILDAKDDVTSIQLQRILQDTADRVDPDAANYHAENGYSDPGGTPTYGYGRINALEAVRLVASTAIESTDHGSGKGGRDLILRDHALDWGNTERDSVTVFSNPRTEIDYYKSVDIKIDVEPYQTQARDPYEFAVLTPEEPVVDKEMRVYVRIRNRGPETVDDANLKIITGIVDDVYPPLPTDLWTNFANPHTDTANWQPLAMVSLEDVEYSGASLAGCPGRGVPECLPAAALDFAQVAMFTVAAMDWDPGTHKGPAIFAVLDSDQDRAQSLEDPPNGKLDVLENVREDNNVTLWTPGIISEETGNGTTPGVCDEANANYAQFLIVLGILLMIYILIRWWYGLPVPIGVHLALIVILLLLLWICMNYPGCIEQAMQRFRP